MRLFVALDPPEPVRTALAVLRTEMPGARWLTPEQMHLTLAFIGDLEDERVPGIEDALAGVAAARFEVALTAFDAFPNRRAPRVLVAGVTAQPALRDLQSRVLEALKGAGVALESRPFRPHLTLARLKRPDRGAVRDFLAQRLPALSFKAAALHLYASELTPDGSRYTRLRMYGLAAA